MWRKIFRKRKRKKVGLMIASIGIGIVITFIIPVWGWIIAVGGALIYFGWCLMENNR
jgi:uncharacterized membrane protein YccC